MLFLQLNQIETHNYGMGSVDIADHLSVFYHPDHWIRNKKWWWSILFGLLVSFSPTHTYCTQRCVMIKMSLQSINTAITISYKRQASTGLILILPTKDQLMKGRTTLYHLLLDRLSEYLLQILYQHQLSSVVGTLLTKV